MKTLAKIPLILMILLLPGWKTAYSRDEISKVTHKEFTVNADAQLVIDNKFGDVHVNNWDKNIISLDVVITVSAGSDNTAAKLMEKISLNITGTESLVQARTVFAENTGSGRSKIKIDYTVSMPYTTSLDLTNKFGDAYINEIGGKGKLTIAYGSLDVNKLNNSDNLLDISFSKGDIRSIKGAVVLLKYSDLTVQYAGSMRLDSKYSNIDAGKIISLNANMSGGKVDMDNTSLLDAKSRFANLDIRKVEKDLNLDIQYGNCEVAEMPADFGNINITNKYGNVSVAIAHGASYSLDASLRFCELSFPESSAKITERIVTNTSKSYKATVGSANASSKVTVRSEYGNVDLE